MKEGVDYRLELRHEDGPLKGWTVLVPCDGKPERPRKHTKPPRDELFPEPPPEKTWKAVGGVSERKEMHGEIWMYYPSSGTPEQRRWWGPCGSLRDAVTRCVHFYLHGLHDPGCWGVGDVRPAECSKCGRRIALGLTKHGRWLPVEPDMVTLLDHQGVFHQGHVNHYLTCAALAVQRQETAKTAEEPEHAE